MLIKVGTRKSPLAIKQSQLACDWLAEHLPEDAFELLPISTDIDSHLDYSLEKQGGTGLFTKELDALILDGTARLAVHSSKDLPIVLDPSLSIAGYLPRASALDVLVSKVPAESIKRIATSSPRRRSQLEHLYPDAEFLTIRGNVETRLNKISDNQADATILAEAGLDRLGISSYKDLYFTTLESPVMVPAAGQGAIAIVCKKEDYGYFSDHLSKDCYDQITLEKECLKILDGGCQSPAGIYIEGSNLHLYHPSLGYKVITLEGDDFKETYSYLQNLMADLKSQIS